jgi:toxin HigB-1
MNKITLHKRVQKQLKRLPNHIVTNLRVWMETVEENGITETRKLSGYHDEPLQGKRAGQRSIRLSKAYRAFYVERDDKITIEVIEVNKHEY